MWKNPKLIPVEERGAFKYMVLGFTLMLCGTLTLYYGNAVIAILVRRVEEHNFSLMLFGVLNIFIHGLQVLLLLLAWISISSGISRYLGRHLILIKLLVSSVGIWITWTVFPLLSDLFVFSFPISLYTTILLVMLFETLTRHVDNWLDKSAALMLWVYSIQSLELMPGGQVALYGMFLTAEEVSVAGTALFLSFVAGAVISTGVLANYSVRLSQVRRLWERNRSDTIEDEDGGLRKVSMVDMRSLVHDLKTPLAAIKGMAFMLRDGSQNSGGAAPDKEKLGIMLNAANYMERMLSEILHEDQLSETNVGAFFDKLDRYARPFPWGEEVAVSIDPGVSQESVALNEIRFTRALLNVLDNAGRANRIAGTQGIELRVRRNAASLEIEILDNGPGIRQTLNYQKTDWSPTGSGHTLARKIMGTSEDRRSTRSGWGSTGLGLAFARKVATAHGGYLLLAPRRDANNGACVLISLPIVNAG